MRFLNCASEKIVPDKRQNDMTAHDMFEQTTAKSDHAHAIEEPVTYRTARSIPISVPSVYIELHIHSILFSNSLIPRCDGFAKMIGTQIV
jgi:hypothetical protein